MVTRPAAMKRKSGRSPERARPTRVSTARPWLVEKGRNQKRSAYSARAPNAGLHSHGTGQIGRHSTN
jgi:hypothetical protein